MEISDLDPKHHSKAHPGGASITHYGMHEGCSSPLTAQRLLDLEKVLAEGSNVMRRGKKQQYLLSSTLLLAGCHFCQGS